jgi:hypothetical protein
MKTITPSQALDYAAVVARANMHRKGYVTVADRITDERTIADTDIVQAIGITHYSKTWIKPWQRYYLITDAGLQIVNTRRALNQLRRLSK